jgi:CRP/FNR family transcriptional regulator
LTHAELRLLDSAKVCRAYRRGEIIFHEGDPCRGVYCVETGLVGIRKVDSEGNTALLERMGFPGATLGYRPYLAGEPHRGSAEALENSVICFVDGVTVKRLLEHNPGLGLQFLERTARALGEAEEAYFQSLTLTARTRFAHLLVVLKERYGTTAEDGSLTLELPMARRDLAAMIGARPESMSRIIRKLNDDGIARFSGRTVEVPSVRRLIDELGNTDYV